MAKSPTEQIRELRTEVELLRAGEANNRTEIEELNNRLRREIEAREAADEKRRDDVAELRKELADARQEAAVLRQQLQDHVAQYQEWDRRRWGLFVLLIGAVMSLASGLVVTLAKK